MSQRQSVSIQSADTQFGSKFAIAPIKDKAYKRAVAVPAFEAVVPLLAVQLSSMLAGHALDAKREIKMRGPVMLLVAMIALGLPATDLFAKGRSSGTHHGSVAKGTGTKTSATGAGSRTKGHVVKGNYNPNTGKRTAKVVRK